MEFAISLLIVVLILATGLLYHATTLDNFIDNIRRKQEE
jgi:hypothetical protein